MLVFNKNIVNEINTKTSKGEPVIVKVKAEPLKKTSEEKKRSNKKVDSVTTGTMETKMHFAQSYVAAQNTTLKKINKP